MGKKAKNTQNKIKAGDQEPEGQEEAKPEQSKRGQAKPSSFDLKNIFSESFRDRLSQYIGLYEQVLDKKAEIEGSDLSEQKEARKKNMSERLETAATDILKLEISSLKEWIGEEQVNLSTDIVKLGKVHDDNKHNLVGTHCFTEEEIANSLNIINKRSAEKQEAYDNYASLIRQFDEI